MSKVLDREGSRPPWASFSLPGSVPPVSGAGGNACLHLLPSHAVEATQADCKCVYRNASSRAPKACEGMLPTWASISPLCKAVNVPCHQE